MIQRKQSIFLLLAATIQVIFATGKYFTFKVNAQDWFVSGSGIFSSINGKESGDMKTLILGLGVAALGLFSLFLFKNRKRQMKLTRIAGLLTIAEIVFLIVSYLDISDLAENGVNLEYPVFILPISTILFFLAVAAIKKDDELVRSVDRIR